MNYSLQDTGLHIGALVHQNSVTLMHLCTLIQLFKAMHIDRLLYSYIFISYFHFTAKTHILPEETPERYFHIIFSFQLARHI